MHSAASTRSPSASNSTSSHLGLVQASSSKDLTVPNHYDHLYFQPSEEVRSSCTRYKTLFIMYFTDIIYYMCDIYTISVSVVSFENKNAFGI